MSDNLKLCPFCGGSPFIQTGGEYSETSPGAECPACGANAPVEEWNKRAVPSVIAEFIHLVSNDNGSSSHNSLIVRCLRRVREYFGVEEGYDGRMP